MKKSFAHSYWLCQSCAENLACQSCGENLDAIRSVYSAGLGGGSRRAEFAARGPGESLALRQRSSLSADSRVAAGIVIGEPVGY